MTENGCLFKGKLRKALAVQAELVIFMEAHKEDVAQFMAKKSPRQLQELGELMARPKLQLLDILYSRNIEAKLMAVHWAERAKYFIDAEEAPIDVFTDRDFAERVARECVVYENIETVANFVHGLKYFNIPGLRFRFPSNNSSDLSDYCSDLSEHGSGASLEVPTKGQQRHLDLTRPISGYLVRHTKDGDDKQPRRVDTKEKLQLPLKAKLKERGTNKNMTKQSHRNQRGPGSLTQERDVFCKEIIKDGDDDDDDDDDDDCERSDGMITPKPATFNRTRRRPGVSGSAEGISSEGSEQSDDGKGEQSVAGTESIKDVISDDETWAASETSDRSASCTQSEQSESCTLSEQSESSTQSEESDLE